MNTGEFTRFLKSLQIDGIEEIYIAPACRAEAVTKETVKESPARKEMLALRDAVLQCTRCTELAAARKKVVFGAGNIHAELVFVGEAPGREEDEQGLPFVGAAGRLLTKIIEAIGYSRKDVFICNVLKCRPPANRPPLPGEIMNCQPYLQSQIKLIRPKMICALGNFAAQALLVTDKSMAQLRGRFHDYQGIAVVCTYHPAYLLRNPGDKRKVWEDMKMMMKELERLRTCKQK